MFHVVVNASQNHENLYKKDSILGKFIEEVKGKSPE